MGKRREGLTVCGLRARTAALLLEGTLFECVTFALLPLSLPRSYSRHSYIADYSQGGTLSDGSPCWKDYSQSRNNRYGMAYTQRLRGVRPGDYGETWVAMGPAVGGGGSSFKEVICTRTCTLVPLRLRDTASGRGNAVTRGNAVARDQHICLVHGASAAKCHPAEAQCLPKVYSKSGAEIAHAH